MNVLLLTIFATSFLSAMPVSEECCQSKEVGGKLYMLLKDRKVDPKKFGCISECLYMTKGSLAKFCFAKGELKVECKDDELDDEEHATTNTTLDFETISPITIPMVTTDRDQEKEPTSTTTTTTTTTTSTTTTSETTTRSSSSG